MFAKVVRALRRKADSSEVRPLRGLHSIRQLRRVLARERARSDRSGDRFSLVVFAPQALSVENETHVRLSRVLRQRLRLTDEAGWLDRHRIAVVLPATPPRGAWIVAQNICQHLPAELLPACNVYCYPSDVSQLEHARQEPSRRGNDEHPVHALELLFARGLPLWKRSIDVVGAALGMVLLAPLLLLIAAGVKFTSRGPIFFRQLRSGRAGRPFVMYKFRSMVIGAEARKAELRALNEQDGPAFKIKDDPRITRLGRLLRDTSLDELPQLWNVLCGQMSLVGPRPLPVDESDACLVWQRRRLDVTPGLTCIWQVQGRSRVTFNEWVRMDLQYVEQRSLWKDLRILLATLPAVLLRRGAR